MADEQAEDLRRLLVFVRLVVVSYNLVTLSSLIGVGGKKMIVIKRLKDKLMVSFLKHIPPAFILIDSFVLMWV